MVVLRSPFRKLVLPTHACLYQTGMSGSTNLAKGEKCPKSNIKRKPEPVCNWPGFWHPRLLDSWLQPLRSILLPWKKE